MRFRKILPKERNVLHSVLHGKITLEEIDWFEWTAPSRIKAIFLYLRSCFWKLLNSNNSSWPYISGDSFRKLADLSISTEDDLKEFNPDSLSKSRIIFVRGDLFERFLKVCCSFITNNHIFVTGNSDQDFETYPEVIAGNKVKWFSQNSQILNDSRVKTIPIGVENLALGNYGRMKHLQISRSFTNDKILFGPMGDTHPSRKVLLSTALQLQNIFYIPPKRLSASQYVNLSSNFKYVFCPRGNGVDTHRFWESMYRGQTPIILNSGWAKSLEGLGFPFISVPSLESLLEYVTSFDFFEPDFNPCEVEALWMPFWKNIIENEALYL